MSAAAPWVLLRGLTREAGHWGAFVPALQARSAAPVICLDLPGAGALHAEACPAQLGQITERCRVQLDALGVAGPVRLLGLSLGGMVAADWAARHPQQVAQAVLVNSSAAGLSPLPQRLQPRHWPLALGLLARWGSPAAERQVLAMSSRQDPLPADVAAQWAQLQRERPVQRRNALRQLWAAAHYRLPARPPALPVLVVRSLGDQLVDPACSLAIARHWGCAMQQHPSAGHDLALDAPGWLADTVQAWAARCASLRS